MSYSKLRWCSNSSGSEFSHGWSWRLVRATPWDWIRHVNSPLWTKGTNPSLWFSYLFYFHLSIGFCSIHCNASHAFFIPQHRRLDHSRWHSHRYWHASRHAGGHTGGHAGNALCTWDLVWRLLKADLKDWRSYFEGSFERSIFQGALAFKIGIAWKI